MYKRQGFGSTGVWYALVIGSILDALYMGARWRGSSWLKIALRKTALYRVHLHKLPELIQQQFLLDVRTPQMARPGTQERVDHNQVTYASSTGKVIVQFKPAGYTLT